MQVRKFEAPTMKEALEMVKNQLGPGAIILNAKDSSSGFGLMGRSSIEITAAITDDELKKRQWAEGRLKEDQLALLRQKSMRVQKEFIEKSVQRYTVNREQERRRPATSVRYIDIDDDNERMDTRASGRTVDELLKEIGQPNQFIENSAVSSDQRVKAAAKSALQAFENAAIAEPPRTQSARQFAQPLNEVEALKREIQQLKSMIQGFQAPRASGSATSVARPQPAQTANGDLSQITNKLAQSGIAPEHINRLVSLARTELKEMISRPSLVEGWIAKHVMSEIRIADHSEASPVQVFLGTTGSGKSASLIKLASDYVIRRNKKIGILTADTEKVGAVDQLRTYAQILNVPFGILKKPQDWQAVVESLKNLDHVLIDFPGNALREMDSIERFRKMLPVDQVPCDKHLVISATFKDRDAFEIAERYRIAKPTDIIFSKLDEAVSHGLIYNFQKQFDLPLFAFGTGPGLPEDFEFATKERVIDLIFQITKMKNKNTKGEY